MIYPIVVYGHPILKKVAVEIDKDYPKLDEIIENMFNTMYEAVGVGLAAPQINKSIRLMVIDADAYSEENPEAEGFTKVFINPEIVEETGDEWEFKEACLSVPKLSEYVSRKSNIRIKYLNEKFEAFDETYDGTLARIIQHEYDHLDGILFVDKISNLKKVLIKNKLKDISLGKSGADYKTILPPVKRKRKR